MAEELGREPTVDEVFIRTHIRKKDKSWVDDRSRETYDTFQTKLSQASEATLEERAKAAEDEVRNTREELRQAELKRQKEVQKSEQQAAEFQRQLIALTNSVAAMQADASLRQRRQRRHPDYDEDESEDGSKDGSEDEYDSTSDDDNEEN
ncbi:hypothetical protein P8452_20927 [Trifolium repens]|nr:hypothetical protein P8452_20927 [Trifolium repens]